MATLSDPRCLPSVGALPLVQVTAGDRPDNAAARPQADPSMGRPGMLPSADTKKATVRWLFSWRIVLPGIDLFSQGATPQISSALQRFTTEFEMDRSGSTAPWTPG